jgi:hypothetical protein
MTGAKAGAGVAVEVFVKQDQVAPVWIALEDLLRAKNGTPAVFPAQKRARQASRLNSRNSFCFDFRFL